jgi:hypothetical protein
MEVFYRFLCLQLVCTMAAPEWKGHFLLTEITQKRSPSPNPSSRDRLIMLWQYIRSGYIALRREVSNFIAV